MLIETPHSLLPVGEGSPDAMVGRRPGARPAGVGPARPAARYQEAHAASARWCRIPWMPRRHGTAARQRGQDGAGPDEYGHFEGLVTPADVLEAIAGSHPLTMSKEPGAVQREDGSWLISGWLAADEMADLLGVVLAGKSRLSDGCRLPALPFAAAAAGRRKRGALGWEFEVVDLDGRRIDRVHCEAPAVDFARALLWSRH